MMSRPQVTVFLAVAAAVWGALLVLQGTQVHAAWMGPLGSVVGVLMLLLAGFDKWLWRLKFLYPWFVDVPNINGTWKGELVSTWTDPKTGQHVPPIEVYLLVKQTFSTLQMRMMTKESASELLAGAIIKEGTTVTATGLYRNIPKLNHRDRSPIHYGGILVHVQGIDAEGGLRLEGQYWTDRKTDGTLLFHDRTDKVFDDFDRASKAEYKTSA
jgi:hypothetical protein